MTPWSAFFDLISPDVPGCSQAAQVSALRQSAISFCEQSLAWKYDHPDIAVSVAVGKYLFSAPGGSVVHAVVYAEFNDSEIETRAMERDISTWDVKHKTGTPEYVLGGPISVTLVPTPDVEGTLKLRVVLKPSPAADGLDDDIYSEYRETIVHGALSRLMLSPKKPYTDAVLANYHAQMFLIKTGYAGLREELNYNRVPLKTSIMKRRT